MNKTLADVRAIIENPGDFIERKNGDFYRLPADSYPDRPEKPAILSKKVGDLTDDELASVAKVKKTYDTAKAEYDATIAERRELDGGLTLAFRRDLEAYHGTTDNPKKDRLWSIAWDQGHSSGLGEVASYYDDMVDLIL
jgi:hypothetical protein